MRPTEDDWLKAIEESVHQRTAVPVLSGPAAEFCLEHPELIEAIKTLLANAQAERLKEKPSGSTVRLRNGLLGVSGRSSKLN
jgi:hypothetical protein